MHKIELSPDDKVLLIKEKETILEASIEAGIPHLHACGGIAKCSSCRIIVSDGLENCCERNEAEKLLAEQLGFKDNMRLACQTTVNGNLKARRSILDDVDLQIIGNQFADQSKSLGEERVASLLFADIEGFTTLSEQSLPYDIVHILNRYYFIMGQTISKYQGRIMDYFGDGFLAIFGLEEAQSGHELNAVKCAKEMQEQMDKLRPYFEQLFGKTLNIRIGVHTGSVIVGTIGIKTMQKLAAIGDSVNMASRIENANKILGSSFLVSETTYNAVNTHFEAKKSHEIPLKGKTGTYKLFEL